MQGDQRLTILQADNKQLVHKNKDLIALLNKNAHSLILYEKQKKELAQANSQLLEINQIKRSNEGLKESNEKM